VHGQTVSPDACENRGSRSRHDVGHTTRGNQRPAKLSQPRRGRLPATTPGNPVLRKARPSPLFDCVSSRWPQQRRTCAPPAGPRASRRPPGPAAATSAPRQSRSGGVTMRRDADQLPCGSRMGLRRRVLRRAPTSPRAGHRPPPTGRAHACCRHRLRIAGPELGSDPPAASGSGAYTSRARARSSLGSGEGN
jgi:hypothetical protein